MDSNQRRDLASLSGSIDIFKSLPPDVKKELLDKFTHCEFPEETPIIFQGQSGEAFYIIASGKLSVNVSDGSKSAQVKTLTRGDYFGEMSLLSEKETSATVKAATEVKLYRLGKEDFEKFLAYRPEVSCLLDEVVNSRRTRTELSRRRLRAPAVPREKKGFFNKIKEIFVKK